LELILYVCTIVSSTNLFVSMSNHSLKTWMAQIRAPFLILAVFLVAIGLAFSVKYPHQASGSFEWLHAVMLAIGVVLSHISVNLFNEYSDFKTRIDFNTHRTPFSGGSGMITSGHTTPGNVRTVGILTLIISGAIGVYFAAVAHWIVLVFAAVGALSVLFYTNFLAKRALGELFAGMALGTFVVLGTYVAMTAEPGMPLQGLFPKEVIWISIPPGILTSLLLLINEFPDAEADREGGRKHLVIRFGWKGASYIYTAGIFATFAIIALMPLIGVSSRWIYLALLPLPLGIKASVTTIRHGNDIGKLIPALGSNVITVLSTDLLLAVGVFIDVF
jgi:1,4-dihydroxy-2-naphthoate octaprenyltransferase